MRRPGILLAAALVLAADALVLVKAAHNRSGSPAVAMELTERELRLVRPQRESTALFLDLAWEPARWRDGPAWFNRAKLEELGYDCRLPFTDPSAPAHYRDMPAREAFAVLEYKEEDRASLSRLLAVDAGRDFARLRGKYPDTRRFLIVPSLVRLSYVDASGAYLRGNIVQVLVSQIWVPPSERHVFESLSQTTNDYFATPEGQARGPRYSVVLHYGSNHEPWIGSCRPIAAAQR